MHAGRNIKCNTVLVTTREWRARRNIGLPEGQLLTKDRLQLCLHRCWPPSAVLPFATQWLEDGKPDCCRPASTTCVLHRSRNELIDDGRIWMDERSVAPRAVDRRQPEVSLEAATECADQDQQAVSKQMH